jgi:hypothetical protein
MEARWQGLNTTLIMPHKKQPKAASIVPPVIHSFAVKKMLSSIQALLVTVF